MNKLTVLFGVLLCMMVVSARHYGDRSESERLTDDDEESGFRKEKEHLAPSRHRRRRWQSNYGYDYQPPSHPFYHDRRDNYNYNQQDVIQQIFRLLDDISASIKRSQQPPPPPPQPIYVPYPVPYYVPVPSIGMPCRPQGAKNPNVTSRFPAMEDTNQNWGFVLNESEDYDDGNDGARPISFDPIKPKQTLKRPAPSVEHGSTQATQVSTQAPSFIDIESSGNGRAPNMCHAAILSCCGLTNKQQQRECFTNVGCSVTYADGRACVKESIAEALQSFKNAYSPIV